MNASFVKQTRLHNTRHGNHFSDSTNEQNICQDCSKKFQRADIKEEDTFLDQITSLYTYNEAMREYLHQFKFLQDVALSKRLRE